MRGGLVAVHRFDQFIPQGAMTGGFVRIVLIQSMAPVSPLTLWTSVANQGVDPAGVMGLYHRQTLCPTGHDRSLQEVTRRGPALIRPMTLGAH